MRLSTAEVKHCLVLYCFAFLLLRTACLHHLEEYSCANCRSSSSGVAESQEPASSLSPPSVLPVFQCTVGMGSFHKQRGPEQSTCWGTGDAEGTEPIASPMLCKSSQRAKFPALSPAGMAGLKAISKVSQCHNPKETKFLLG